MTDNPSKIPPRLAVDAHGYVWRVYDDGWSMPPANPDNNPIPQPVTFYEPVTPQRQDPDDTWTPAEPARLADALTAAGCPWPSSRLLSAALMPVLDAITEERVRQAKSEVWSLAASWVGPPFEQEFRDRAAALRGPR